MSSGMRSGRNGEEVQGMSNVVSTEDLKRATDMLMIINHLDPHEVSHERAFSLARLLGDFRADILQGVLRSLNEGEGSDV